MVTILEESHWEDLFNWVEGQPAREAVRVTRSAPIRVNRLSIWLHDRPSRFTALTSPAISHKSSPEENNISSKFQANSRKHTQISSQECLKSGSPGSSIYSDGSSPPTASGAGLQGVTRRTGAVAVQSQFRALTEIEMEPLKQRPNDKTSLWPKPNRHTGSWPSHNLNEITLFLADALGYLTGTAPISDDELAKYTWNEKLPFKVPVKVLLDIAYRSDAIMDGLYSPSENLGGKRQHWQARNYIVHPDSDMGAVIEVADGVFRPGTIDVCELQALVILLDRQMMYCPEKAKPRAWVVSIKPEHFRVLEAYLDQRVNPYEFHFSIVEECSYIGARTKRLDGKDKEWKWLLSWALAQLLKD
ncbi:hypothetical protein PG984_015475 [Apiospora sp. TS-2023a]